MLKLYTAVGISDIRTINGQKQRVFLTGNRVYFPSAPESILWHSALFGIYTCRELKHIYLDNMAKAHVDSDISFEWYLNHLEENGFIAGGQDETIEDSLYDLLKDLYIEVPRAAPLLLKLKSFLGMLWRGMPLKQARKIFHQTHYTGSMGNVLRAASRNDLTTAELVCWAASDKTFSGSVQDTVYGGEETQRDISRLGRFKPERMEVVKAVTELYLKREIMFEKLGTME